MMRRGGGAKASYQHAITTLYGRHAQVHGHCGTRAFFIRRDLYTFRAATDNYQQLQRQPPGSFIITISLCLQMLPIYATISLALSAILLPKSSSWCAHFRAQLQVTICRGENCEGGLDVVVCDALHRFEYEMLHSRRAVNHCDVATLQIWVNLIGRGSTRCVICLFSRGGKQAPPALRLSCKRFVRHCGIKRLRLVIRATLLHSCQ